MECSQSIGERPRHLLEAFAVLLAAARLFRLAWYLASAGTEFLAACVVQPSDGNRCTIFSNLPKGTFGGSARRSAHAWPTRALDSRQ